MGVTHLIEASEARHHMFRFFFNSTWALFNRQLWIGTKRPQGVWFCIKPPFPCLLQLYPCLDSPAKMLGRFKEEIKKTWKKQNAICLSFWTFYNWNWTSTALPSLKFNTTNYIYEFHFYKQKLNILIDTSLPSKTHSTSHHGWQSNHMPIIHTSSQSKTKNLS